MGASNFLAACIFVVVANMCAPAQAGNAPPQSSSHPSGHHVQVPADEDAQPTEVTRELTAAEAAIEKHDYAAAESLLHKLLASDPTNYVGWFDLGFVENALGKVEDSIAAYRKSVDAKPEIFESNLNLGLQLAKTGDPEAEKFLRAATRLTPTGHPEEGQYRAWLSLGHVIAKAKPEEALDAFRHAATLQPKDVEPHLSAGVLLEGENKFPEAEQEYKRALALDPHSSDAALGLANIYMLQHRLPEAEQYLTRLAAEHPDAAPIHIQLGRVLAAEGKEDAAIAELEAGSKVAPGDEAVRRDLAELYFTAEKNDLAEGSFRALLANHNNDAELHRRLGEVLLREKKFPDAQQEFMTAVKLNPNLGEAYGGLAFAAGENKNYPLVVRALDARVKFLPEVPTTYFMRASAYDHLRDFKNAAINYRLFLKTADGNYPDQEWQAKHRLIAIEPRK